MTAGRPKGPVRLQADIDADIAHQYLLQEGRIGPGVAVHEPGRVYRTAVQEVTGIPPWDEERYNAWKKAMKRNAKKNGVRYRYDPRTCTTYLQRSNQDLASSRRAGVNDLIADWRGQQVRVFNGTPVPASNALDDDAMAAAILELLQAISRYVFELPPSSIRHLTGVLELLRPPGS